VAHAARVKQRSYSNRHSNILIVATTVVRFKNMFQNSMTCFRVVCDCRENVVGVHGGLICPKAKLNQLY